MNTNSSDSTVLSLLDSEGQCENGHTILLTQAPAPAQSHDNVMVTSQLPLPLGPGAAGSTSPPHTIQIQKSDTEAADINTHRIGGDGGVRHIGHDDTELLSQPAESGIDLASGLDNAPESLVPSTVLEEVDAAAISDSKSNDSNAIWPGLFTTTETTEATEMHVAEAVSLNLTTQHEDSESESGVETAWFRPTQPMMAAYDNQVTDNNFVTANVDASASSEMQSLQPMSESSRASLPSAIVPDANVIPMTNKPASDYQVKRLTASNYQAASDSEAQDPLIVTVEARRLFHETSELVEHDLDNAEIQAQNELSEVYLRLSVLERQLLRTSITALGMVLIAVVIKIIVPRSWWILIVAVWCCACWTLFRLAKCLWMYARLNAEAEEYRHEQLSTVVVTTTVDSDDFDL
jgi:hypothetical protein